MSKRTGPSRPSRLPVLLAVLVLSGALAACGGSEGDGSAPVEPSSSGAFPVTLANKFGTTKIPAEPQRVVTVGFNDQDLVLALDVIPVGERENLGEYDATTRPCAEDLLPAEDIPTVGGEEINLEAVAALEPDLIVGVYSFMDQTVYDQLSGIAPTLAQTDEYADGATPWQEQTLLIGQALGRAEQAQQLVDDVEGQVEQAVNGTPISPAARSPWTRPASAQATTCSARTTCAPSSSPIWASPSPTPAPTSARSGWTC